MTAKKGKKFLSLCMIVKNEAERIQCLWESVKHVVDEWVVVDTGSTDGTVELVKKIGKGKAKVIEKGDEFCEVLNTNHVEFFKKWGVDVAEGEKVFNFGKARTESFKHATGEYILWLDGDDVLIGSDKLREIMELNLSKDKQLGLHLMYRYEVDQYQNDIVKHYRERVFPNNGKFNWVGRIHEIVVPELETQYIVVKESDCHVLHNIPVDVKKAESHQRNLRALLLDLYEQGDKPDPRTLFQVAETLVGSEKTRERALELYKQYMELSGWDEERALACTRICDIYLKLGDNQKALEWAYKSIQQRPDWPQGYANVAQCYYVLDDYSNAILFAEDALGKEQPQTMAFVNEKHNKFTPFLILTSCCFKLGKIEDAIVACEEALKIEPLNEYLLNILSTCKRAITEEKIAGYYKNIADYLIKEHEIAKTVELFKSLPWSHEQDPRVLGVKESSEKALLKALQAPKKPQDDLEFEKLHEQLPHLAFLEKELTSRGAKRVFLVSSENNPLVGDWLREKGFDVSQIVQEGEKFDAVVAFGLIEKVYDISKVLNFLVNHTEKNGLCVVSSKTGYNESDDEAQVRVYTVNSLDRELTGRGLKVINSIPLSNQVIYTSFLPGQLREVKSSVAFVCGEAVEEWGPLSLYSGIGGSEEATIHLSQELAAEGHEVVVYNKCSHDCIFRGVRWKHYSSLNEKTTFDNVVLWRIPHHLDIFKISARKKFLWLHDVPEVYWFTEKRLKEIDKIIVLSKFHRSLLPNIPDEKFIISQNGINVEDFQKEEQRNPLKVIYTSSYDRGLENLLDIWGDVRSEVPSAELHVYYGWGQWDKMRTRETQRQWKSQMIEKLKQPGVFEHGRLGQLELAKEYLRSGVFAYPCHFEEISCISAMKSQAAGCIPLTTDYAALAETNLIKDCQVKGDIRDPIVKQRFKGALVEILKSAPDRKLRQKIASNAKKQFSWKTVAKKWSEFLGG